MSCRQVLKDNNLLTVTPLYVLEVVCYAKKCRDSIEHNVQICKYNT
jgi:hypothetical protein